MLSNLWITVIMITVMAAASACGANGGASYQTALPGSSDNGKPSPGAYSTMTAPALQAELDAGQKPVIVDLREPELFRAGRIPGAGNIPFEQFDDRANELSSDANIVLVRHTGPMGEVSGALLVQRGYTRVRNLAGGMAAWRGKLEK